MRRGLVVTAFLVAAQVHAHPMPNSTVVVESVPTEIVATLSIPLSELAVALGVPVSLEGTARVALETYVRAHIAITVPDGQPWPMNQLWISVVNIEHLTLSISLLFAEPPGARKPTLRYDAVNHQVASHYALVYRRVGGKLVPLGRLQSPATMLPIP